MNRREALLAPLLALLPWNKPPITTLQPGYYTDGTFQPCGPPQEFRGKFTIDTQAIQQRMDSVQETWHKAILEATRKAKP